MGFSPSRPNAHRPFQCKCHSINQLPINLILYKGMTTCNHKNNAELHM